MPQPLESGIYGHQRGDDLHAVVPAATTGVNLPGNLVEVVPHAGKLTKQRRRERGKLARGRVSRPGTSGASRLQAVYRRSDPADGGAHLRSPTS